MPSNIKTTEDLFGPIDSQGSLTAIVPNTWQWPGSCVTGHCTTFQSGLGMPLLARAVWRMCLSQPAGRTLFRLVTLLDGVQDVTPIGYIDTDNKPPSINVWNTGILVQDPLNAFFQSNCNTPEVNVGWQVCGDNTNPFTVFACRLELTWSIP